eukprot:TRINITY_DN50311_c0_g1_i1.p1 TRINITY_DN50311_c0_g1~~TRINITY_DN50311_c0_g1_i1.p1  ORF type:complete len:1165 (+),score=331.83 TRINITY_DN50311_c0_g1_i1:82-3576(+)
MSKRKVPRMQLSDSEGEASRMAAPSTAGAGDAAKAKPKKRGRPATAKDVEVDVSTPSSGAPAAAGDTASVASTGRSVDDGRAGFHLKCCVCKCRAKDADGTLTPWKKYKEQRGNDKKLPQFEFCRRHGTGALTLHPQLTLSQIALLVKTPGSNTKQEIQVVCDILDGSKEKDFNPMNVIVATQCELQVTENMLLLGKDKFKTHFPEATPKNLQLSEVTLPLGNHGTATGVLVADPNDAYLQVKRIWRLTIGSNETILPEERVFRPSMPGDMVKWVRQQRAVELPAFSAEGVQQMSGLTEKYNKFLEKRKEREDEKRRKLEEQQQASGQNGAAQGEEDEADVDMEEEAEEVKESSAGESDGEEVFRVHAPSAPVERTQAAAASRPKGSVDETVQEHLSDFNEKFPMDKIWEGTFKQLKSNMHHMKQKITKLGASNQPAKMRHLSQTLQGKLNMVCHASAICGDKLDNWADESVEEAISGLNGIDILIPATIQVKVLQREINKTMKAGRVEDAIDLLDLASQRAPQRRTMDSDSEGDGKDDIAGPAAKFNTQQPHLLDCDLPEAEKIKVQATILIDNVLGSLVECLHTSGKTVTPFVTKLIHKVSAKAEPAVEKVRLMHMMAKEGSAATSLEAVLKAFRCLVAIISPKPGACGSSEDDVKWVSRAKLSDKEPPSTVSQMAKSLIWNNVVIALLLGDYWSRVAHEGALTPKLLGYLALFDEGKPAVTLSKLTEIMLNLDTLRSAMRPGSVEGLIEKVKTRLQEIFESIKLETITEIEDKGNVTDYCSAFATTMLDLRTKCNTMEADGLLEQYAASVNSIIDSRKSEHVLKSACAAVSFFKDMTPETPEEEITKHMTALMEGSGLQFELPTEYGKLVEPFLVAARDSLQTGNLPKKASDLKAVQRKLDAGLAMCELLTESTTSTHFKKALMFTVQAAAALLSKFQHEELGANDRRADKDPDSKKYDDVYRDLQELVTQEEHAAKVGAKLEGVISAVRSYCSDQKGFYVKRDATLLQASIKTLGASIETDGVKWDNALTAESTFEDCKEQFKELLRLDAKKIGSSLSAAKKAYNSLKATLLKGTREDMEATIQEQYDITLKAARITFGHLKIADTLMDEKLKRNERAMWQGLEQCFADCGSSKVPLHECYSAMVDFAREKQAALKKGSK